MLNHHCTASPPRDIVMLEMPKPISEQRCFNSSSYLVDLLAKDLLAKDNSILCVEE